MKNEAVAMGDQIRSSAQRDHELPLVPSHQRIFHARLELRLFGLKQTTHAPKKAGGKGP